MGLRLVGFAVLAAACVSSTVSAAPLNAGLGTTPEGLDRSSPYATTAGLLDAVHAGELGRAAHYLYLDHLPAGLAAERGPQLARRLTVVLDRKLWLDFSTIPRTTAPADPAVAILGEIPLGGRGHPVRLQRVERDGQAAWVFGEDTVRAVDALFAEHGSPFLERLPAFVSSRTFWVLELWQWLGLGLALAIAALLALLTEKAALGIAARAARFSRSALDDQLVAAGRGPLRYLLLAFLMAIAGRLLALPPPARNPLDLVARSVAVVALAWFAVRFLALGAAFLEQRIAGEEGDVGRVRGAKTQIAVLKRVFEAATYLLASAALLVQFDSVRNVGVSLLASAGIAGLVLGLAAQKSISTLLAGIQLTITQPVRIGDTVIVEKEWGWIEEITLTYVVVKVWDLRRLIVPMTYFLDKPFENWSKVSPDILGTIELRADYRTDVEAVRAELGRVLESERQGLWDGKVQGVQVTDVSERTMTLRALISASDAGKAWDLRCLVREKLLAFLVRTPEALPTVRAEASHRWPNAGSVPPPEVNEVRLGPRP